MKKVSLILVMLGIIYFSDTPHLRVSDPTTWINPSNYEQGIAMEVFYQLDSPFYYLYSNILSKEFILHKLGHIVFYFLLTLFLYLNVKIKKYNMPWMAFFVFLFALSDEIHQYFVIGRSGRILDVLLDTTVGIITLFIISYIQKAKNKQLELKK